MQQFGTDLESAYSMLSPESGLGLNETPRAVNDTDDTKKHQRQPTTHNQQPTTKQQIQPQQLVPRQPEHLQPIQHQQSTQHKQSTQQQVIKQSAGAPQPGLLYDANQYNQQYEHEYKAAYARHQHEMAIREQQSVRQQSELNEPGYIDKLIVKKRDLLKIIIFALMILLAISIHTAVDYWLKDIATAYQLTYKQELGVRVLYPIVILILLWNLKVWASK